MSGPHAVGDGKDWARRIVARHQSGQSISRYPLQAAREVLGLEPPPPKSRSTEQPGRRDEPVPQ